MPNVSGQAYGLTVLSPILPDAARQGGALSPSAALRGVLASLPTGAASPLAKTVGTHFVRWTVIDDVFFQGAPAIEEHLRSRYLLFTSDFDGELDLYLADLFAALGDDLLRIWGHCVGFPAQPTVPSFTAYIRRCQITTTYFFADYPDAPLTRVLTALATQRRFIQFAESAQGLDDAALQAAFNQFIATPTPTPKPGSI